MPSEEEWSPEGEPNPEQIFQQAREDTAARRYPEALAKRLWFHRHALAPAFAGVRLSYALYDWMLLAAVYPPALEALTALRDECEKMLSEGHGGRDEFIDCAAINRVLDQEERTFELFQRLNDEQPELAAAVFDVARPALVRAKAYRLCRRFLNPTQDLAHAQFVYRLNRQLASDPKFGTHLRQFAEQTFANEVATLVALLVINGRRDEAQWMVSGARREWPVRKFKQLLQRSLRGEMPDPWP
jgi:hypothetical protein